MARVNQGYYREIREKFKNIENEINTINNCTFDFEGVIIGDREDLWGRLEDYSYLYEECVSFIYELNTMLKSQKFESESIKTEYEDMLSSAESIKSDSIVNYRTVKDMFNCEFSDAEIRSINSFSIERE